MIGGMASSFLPLKDLLPKTLAELSEKSGAGETLAPLWNEGGSDHRNTKLGPHDKVLTVKVSSQKWRGELAGKGGRNSPELRRLGRGVVERLDFRFD